MKRFLRKYNLVRLFIYTIVLAACFIALSAYFSENNVTTWQQTISSIKTPRYVTCTIQNDVKIPCINESNKIFIPFDFISKKFDVCTKFTYLLFCLIKKEENLKKAPTKFKTK